jgi:hypothetical protein
MTREQTVTAIAEAFVEKLRAELTADEWTAMRQLNAEEPHPHVCHSHDFTDANDVMCEAFTDVLGLPADPTSDENCALWSDAWDHAMPALGRVSR